MHRSQRLLPLHIAERERGGKTRWNGGWKHIWNTLFNGLLFAFYSNIGIIFISEINQCELGHLIKKNIWCFNLIMEPWKATLSQFHKDRVKSGLFVIVSVYIRSKCVMNYSIVTTSYLIREYDSEIYEKKKETREFTKTEFLRSWVHGYNMTLP